MKNTKAILQGHMAPDIDWEELRRRLEIGRVALETGLATGVEDKRKILRERAQALARPAAKEISAQEQIEVVEFLLAHERYAIESDYVREVYPLKELTPLPCTPPFVLGVINVRGQILSVIDIKKFFDLPEKGLTDLNKVIIVQSGNMQFGILADVILGIRQIAHHDMQPSLPTLTGIRGEYLRGVTKDRLIALDAGKILSDKNIVVYEEARE